MRLLLLILTLLIPPTLAHAQGVAVVKSAAPISNGGTQDFVGPSGFGTPVCAMFFLGYGTANGTAVDHAMLSVGVSDFTNIRSFSHVSRDTGGTTDTRAERSATGLITLLASDQSVDGTAIASTITDGVRLTWSDAPPAAYLVTAVLFSSAAFSNCAVGTVTPSGSVDGTASVSGLGWQPDVIVGLYAGSTVNARTSLGFGLNDGGVIQLSAAQASTTNSATSTVAEFFRDDRIAENALSPTTVASLQLTSFDSGGFTITTRDSSTSVNDLYYLAAKLQTGISAKLLACTSPTSTGAHSCTGTGWTPQAGIMLHTLAPGLNTHYTTVGNVDAYGISAFTASTASSSSIADDDATTTANTESITSINPVRLRRASADLMTATFSGFQADGANFNYTLTDSTARYRAILFIQAPAVSFGKFRRREP